jgi:hypothetical protein
MHLSLSRIFPLTRVPFLSSLTSHRHRTGTNPRRWQLPSSTIEQVRLSQSLDSWLLYWFSKFRVLILFVILILILLILIHVILLILLILVSLMILLLTVDSCFFEFRCWFWSCSSMVFFLFFLSRSTDFRCWFWSCSLAAL